MKKMNGFFGKAILGIAAILTAALTFAGTASAEELTGLTANEITAQMGKGWNLGNTLDARDGNKSDIYSQETSWGNPRVTKELIDGVKAAGFDTIRIPVTWYKHISSADGYAIDKEWLDRVQEVVDYAYDNDMYIILNVHHEKWVNDPDIDKNYVDMGVELEAVWKQIADRFADYDQHLIFEGMNEPRAEGRDYEWVGNADCYKAVNYLNQVFVNTIRNNGKGHNGERALMIPGYAASSNPIVLNSIIIPEYNGAPAENVIISVHCYSPYNFCLSDAQSTFNPESSADTSDITSLMGNLDRLFLKNGIPVVIGECGCTNTNNNVEARAAWFAYFGKITADYGIPAIIWDNGAKGSSGGECHNYFDRKTGEMAYPELISAFISYVDLSKVAADTTIDFESTTEGGTSVIADLDKLGFSPSTVKNKFKINHTDGVAMGFALCIDGDTADRTAYLDITRFKGNNIRVSVWVRADEADTVEIGIKNSEVVPMAGCVADNDWIELVFYYAVADGDKSIYFKGESDKTFFVDDIAITIVDDAELASGVGTGFLAAGETGATATEGDATGDAIDDNATAGGDSTDIQKTGTPIWVYILIVVGVAIIGGAIGAVIGTVKNKKK